MTTELPQLVNHDDRDVLKLVEARRVIIAERAEGRAVTLNTGKYEGRTARIEGVMSDGLDWLFLCMVLRADGSGPLNTDPESRSYRTTQQFTEVGTDDDDT